MRRYLVGAVLVTVAACSSSTPTMNTSGSGNPGGGGSNPPPGSGSVSVGIVDYAFSPSSATITVGTTVMWTNNGSVEHTTTSDANTWNSGQLSGATSGGGTYGGGTAGASFQHTFATAGTFTYHCANHTYMTGTITVTP